MGRRPAHLPPPAGPWRARSAMQALQPPSAAPLPPCPPLRCAWPRCRRRPRLKQQRHWCPSCPSARTQRRTAARPCPACLRTGTLRGARWVGGCKQRVQAGGGCKGPVQAACEARRRGGCACGRGRGRPWVCTLCGLGVSVYVARARVWVRLRAWMEEEVWLRVRRLSAVGLPPVCMRKLRPHRSMLLQPPQPHQGGRQSCCTHHPLSSFWWGGGDEGSRKTRHLLSLLQVGHAAAAGQQAGGAEEDGGPPKEVIQVSVSAIKEENKKRLSGQLKRNAGLRASTCGIGARLGRVAHACGITHLRRQARPCLS